MQYNDTAYMKEGNRLTINRVAVHLYKTWLPKPTECRYAEGMNEKTINNDESLPQSSLACRAVTGVPIRKH